jgi:hypothetical protein
MHLRHLLPTLACLAGALLCAPPASADERTLSVLVMNGVNDPDWPSEPAPSRPRWKAPGASRWTSGPSHSGQNSPATTWW